MRDPFYFVDHYFGHNSWLLATSGIALVAIVFARYLLLAWLYKVIVEWLTNSQRNRLTGKRQQIAREIRWAFLSTLVFAALASGMWWLYQQGATQVYEDIRDYPIWYFFVSPAILLILYETYYYWLHRWMHLPKIFRIVHRVHHESRHPTVFTSFAFHPLEAFLQFAFFPLILFAIPFHYIALIIVFTLMSVSAVINHSGVEIFRSRVLLNNVIGATHHDNHHKHFNRNFGLYFTWWDKWMKTEKTDN